MVNSWIESTREYTKDGQYSVPKKGTPEHDAVSEIQKRHEELKLEIPVVTKKEEIGEIVNYAFLGPSTPR